MKLSANADALSLTLPKKPYLPGQTPRPEDDAFDHVKELAPMKTLSEDAQSNVTWHFGLRLLAEGFYWEAHEVLETVWLRSDPNSREFHLVRGIIHVANGKLKEALDQSRAAARLYQLALESIERAYAGNQEIKVMGLGHSEISNFLISAAK